MMARTTRLHLPPAQHAKRRPKASTRRINELSKPDKQRRSNERAKLRKEYL